jgi:hypothetical protein
VAIEALLAGVRSDELDTHREPVAAAANAALSGALAGEHAAVLEDAVAAMEKTLKRRRLGA